MKMKPTFLRSAICALTILLTVFAGCKKSSNDPVPEPVQLASGTMTFKLGGVKYTMPLTQGVYTSQAGFYMYALTGVTLNSNQTASLGISSDKTLTTGSYSFVFDGNGDPKKVITLTVITDVAKQTVSTIYPGAKTSVNITSVTPTLIQGTFTSEIAEYNEATSTWVNKKSVTEGSFNVPIINVED